METELGETNLHRKRLPSRQIRHARRHTIHHIESFQINSVLWFGDDYDYGDDYDLDSMKESALIESWRKVWGEFFFKKISINKDED